MNARKSASGVPQTLPDQSLEVSSAEENPSEGSLADDNLDEVTISDDSESEEKQVSPTVTSPVRPAEPHPAPPPKDLIDGYQAEVDKMMAPGRPVDPNFDLEKELRFLTANDDKEVVTNGPNADGGHYHFPTLRFTTANYYKAIAAEALKAGQTLRLFTFTLFENRCAAFADSTGFVRVINVSTNTMDVIPVKANLHGDATALAFTPDFSLFIIGHSRGDLRVFDTHDYRTQILLVSRVLENAVCAIQPVSKSDVVVADCQGNAFVVQIKRGYIRGDSAEYERIEHLRGLPIHFLESASLSLASEASLFLAGLKTTNSVSLFEVRANKAYPLEFLRSEDGFQIQAAVFNMQRYAAASPIVFGLTTSTTLYVYELLGRYDAKDNTRLSVTRLVKVALPDPSLRTFHWLNEFTFAMFTENCESIFLVNFSSLLAKDPQTTRPPPRGHQIEKDFLPPTANFRLAPGYRREGSWSRITERSFKPKSLALLSETGVVLTVALRFWREALEIDLNENNEDGFFKNFLRVLYGKHTFFNDFVADPLQRKAAMNAYFCEKVRGLCERKFYVLAKNALLLFETLIELNNYEFLLYNVRREFGLRDQADLFDSLFDAAIEANRVRRVPSAYLPEICQSLVRRGKAGLVNTISLRVDPTDPALSTLATFCLEHSLFFAYLFLKTITFTDDFLEALQLLFNRAKDEPPPASEDSPASVGSPSQLLLWFPHQFFRRDFFGREYDFADFELFLRALFVTYFNPANARVLFRHSWRDALRCLESFLLPDVFALLKSEELLTFASWQGFRGSFPDVFADFPGDTRTFCEFYLSLAFDLRADKLSEDPDAVFRKVVDITRSPRFLFPDFLGLVERFVGQFGSHFSEAFALQFADLLATNCLDLGAPTVFLECLLNILIRLGLFESLFLLIGHLPRDVVKGFIFDYIEGRIAESPVRDRFVVELKYFLLMNAPRTFRILHRIAGELDLAEVDRQLASFPEDRFRLYQHLIDHRLPQADDRAFLNKYFGLLAFRAHERRTLNAELEVVEFIAARFSVLDFWAAYALLHSHKLFLALATLFESSGNAEKAFLFYFYALKRAHPNDDAVGFLADKTVRFLDFHVQAITPSVFPLDSKSAAFHATLRFVEFARPDTPTEEFTSEEEDSPPPKPRPSSDSIGDASPFPLAAQGETGLRQSAGAELTLKTAPKTKPTSSVNTELPPNGLAKSAVIRKRSVSNSRSPPRNHGAPSALASKHALAARALAKTQTPQEKSKELAGELGNLGILLPDFLGFCGQGHPDCLTVQTAVLSHLMTLPAPPALLQSLWDNHHLHPLPIQQAIKEYSGLEGHLDIVLGVFRFEFGREAVTLKQGARLQERCHVCRRNMVLAEELENTVIIAKPACGHIFHKECYLRKFGIDEDTVQGDVFGGCLLCGANGAPPKPHISQIVKQGKVGGRSLMSAIMPIGNVVTGTATGIKWILDSAFTLNGPTPENSERKRRRSSAIIRKKSMNLMRRQTTKRISRVSNRLDAALSPVDVWLSQLGASGVTERFEGIMDDDRFGALPTY